MTILATSSRAIVRCQPEHVPAQLRKLPQWVCWKFISRDGKPSKCPIDPHTGRRASTTAPKTWSTFDEAVARFKRESDIEGVGFVFTSSDAFTGIDLDGCVEADGVIADAAQAIIDDLNSYTETSPSGCGVKIIVMGNKPSDARCKTTNVDGFDAVEIYSDGRFFTMTGQQLAGTPSSIEARNEELASLCHRLWPARPDAERSKRSRSRGQRVCIESDDDALIERACAAKNGAKFHRLWDGDSSGHDGDESAADLALCSILAFWTDGDADRMDRLFRRSKRYRPKWDEMRGQCTYGHMTIVKALANNTGGYASNHSASKCALSPINGPGGISLSPISVGRTPTRSNARFAVLIDQQNTDTELHATDTTNGLPRAVNDLVEIARSRDMSIDQEELKAWLRTVLTSTRLNAIAEELKEIEAAQSLTEEATGESMQDVAYAWMQDYFKPAFTNERGEFWSERCGRYVNRHEFTNHIDPQLLQQLLAARDCPDPTKSDPSRIIRHAGFILKPVWSGIVRELPDQIHATSLGPASKAAAAFRQQILDLWLSPETWMRFDRNGGEPEHVERMSLASRARQLADDAVLKTPVWTRVLKGVDAFFRVEHDDAGDRIVWLAMRAGLCRGQIKGHTIGVVQSQTQLTALLKRYGLADTDTVPDRLREDQRQSRICVLSRPLCDLLVECVDEELDDGAVTPGGAGTVTAPQKTARHHDGGRDAA